MFVADFAVAALPMCDLVTERWYQSSASAAKRCRNLALSVGPYLAFARADDRRNVFGGVHDMGSLSDRPQAQSSSHGMQK